MPGAKYRSIKRPKVYEALRRKGYSKAKAARIANAKRATEPITRSQKLYAALGDYRAAKFGEHRRPVKVLYSDEK